VSDPAIRNTFDEACNRVRTVGDTRELLSFYGMGGDRVQLIQFASAWLR
jgi:hypothetical protein